MSTIQHRTEKDLLGERAVQRDACYGVHTLHAGRSIRQLVLDRELLTSAELVQALHPASLMHPRSVAAA